MHNSHNGTMTVVAALIVTIRGGVKCGGDDGGDDGVEASMAGWKGVVEGWQQMRKQVPIGN